MSWRYAEEILTPPRVQDPTFDLVVTDVTSATVGLRPTDRAGVPGVHGLHTPHGYARVGPVLETRGEHVVRALEATLRGEIEAGDPARLDCCAYPSDDPGSALLVDVAVQEVTVEGPTGPLPAYLTPGDSEVWVLFVHGRGGRRSQAFRLLPTVVARGHPSLAVTYRNSPEAPAADAGRDALGSTEWADLDAAVSWARGHGARAFVLVGYSMGAVIVGNWLRRRGSAHVRGVVYDAPVLAWGPTLRMQAAGRGLPFWTAPLAQLLASVRGGIVWRHLDQLARPLELAVPVLLFHGDADEQVPVATSDALAAARPDLVTYVRVPGAGHLQAWNADPDAYTAAVEKFLADVGA